MLSGLKAKAQGVKAATKKAAATTALIEDTMLRLKASEEKAKAAEAQSAQALAENKSLRIENEGLLEALSNPDAFVRQVCDLNAQLQDEIKRLRALPCMQLEPQRVASALATQALQKELDRSWPSDLNPEVDKPAANVFIRQAYAKVFSKLGSQSDTPSPCYDSEPEQQTRDTVGRSRFYSF